MHDRSHGISGYQPTRHPLPVPEKEGDLETPSPRHRAKDLFDRAKKKTSTRTQGARWPLHKKILASLAALFFAGLFLIWFFLGEFRFLFWRAPSLTGFPFGTRTYIVLFQNNYELRPTGGFISNYAELTFSHGVYTGISFHDVYAEIDEHEEMEAPLVMTTLLDNGSYAGMTFRDANFDPDFRLSKDELIEFYKLTNSEAEIDGVFAVDFHFLEEWIGMFDSVTVEGTTFTRLSLFETLSSLVSDIDQHDEEALATRKDIAGPLVQKLLAKTLIFPWRVLEFRDLLAEGFREKHVLAAMNRDGLASSFRARNWDGALPQSDMGDFLVINEGNYGGMKTDRYLTRDVQYELEITDQKDVLGNPIVKATVSITLSNEGGNNPPLSGTFTGYLRTLIPLSSKVLTGSTISEEREDSEVLGELVTLAPGESKTFIYTYELPEYVWNDGVYHLHLHKQPGTDGDRYRVLVKAPVGMGLDAPNFDVRESVAFLDLNLFADTNLSFSLLPDANPPRLVSHEITALNEITLVFNENLDSLYAADPDNFKITDLNQASDATDEVTVLSATAQGNVVVLTTAGMTAQEEEFYEVLFEGLSDSHGNVQEPNPRTATVVQRNLPAEPETLDTPETTSSSEEPSSLPESVE